MCSSDLISPNYVNWNVTAPDESAVGSPGGCYTTTAVGCPAAIMTLPQTGTYTINITPVDLQTVSATVAVAENVTGTLTPGTTQTLNFSAQAGQAARFTFTVTSGQSLTASLASVATLPSNVQIWMGVYTLSESYVTGAATTAGETLNLSLSPGTYYLWIGSLSMVTSGTMQLSFQ